MTEAELLKVIDRAVRENATSLDLSSKNIKTIPPQIANLTNLIELDLAGNDLTELPPEIGSLQSLETLILGKWDEENEESMGNWLTTLPDEIANLTNLTELNLSYNQITEIPYAIANLTNLTGLNLSRNKIRKIPEAIANLTNLTSRDLSGNQITEIPEAIANLTNLTSLDLSGNQITEIPDAIANLTNLTGLYLSSNQITEIPEAIANLTNLTELNLSYNQITEIPDAIANLTNLTGLYLDNNQITEIPDAIANLTNLTGLDLYNNQIRLIPDAIANLTNLTELYLSINQITEIPDAIANLTNLTELYLSSNQIRSIPDAIPNLTNLTWLNLSINQIRSIPDTIANLTNLTSLKLSENQITKIPDAIANLTNLTSLKLEGNPIEYPPLEVALKGIKSIREFFRQVEEQGMDTLYEAKLSLIGEGGAGKTSLAKKILDRNYQLDPNEKKTEGVAIIRWSFPYQDREFWVNIWEFGGQEIYHSTHQFFLSKRSLYALVVDERKEDTDFYYWLEVAELLGENSPLLIIKNEKQHSRSLPEPELRKQFGHFLKDIIPANLANNHGLNDIEKQICHHITSLPHVGDKLPKTWIRVRTALENDPRNYISLEEYLTICATQGFKLERDKLQLSEYLHDLGICLHFQNEPLLNKTIILKPNWATNAVYRVLDHPKVRDETFGKFTTQDLKTIWSDSSYSPVRDELLQLMKKFQLCYEIPNNPDTFIAPRLLPTEPLPYNWDNNENLLLRYTYNFMPKGILSRLIVAMHERIENQSLVWRTGVVLKNKSTRAEIIEYYNKKEIHIRIVGNSRRDLMTIINDKLQEIHKTFNRNKKHLKFNILVPCICPQCLHNQNPFFFTLENLQNRRENKNSKAHVVQCDKSFEDISVFQLTDDFSFSQYQNIKTEVTMSQDPKITNTFHNTTIANFANTLEGNARQQANQHIHQAPNPNLTQAAKEIKELLNQLDLQYDLATPTGQAMINAKAIESIEHNPQLKDRAINALKEFGASVLEEAINHPVANVLIATFKGFTDA